MINDSFDRGLNASTMLMYINKDALINFPLIASLLLAKEMPRIQSSDFSLLLKIAQT